MENNIMNEHVKEIEISSYSSYVEEMIRREVFAFSSNHIYHHLQILSKNHYPINESDKTYPISSDNEKYPLLFSKFCLACLNYPVKEVQEGEEGSGIRILITMNDGTEKDLIINYTSFDASDEDLQYIFYLMRKMFPRMKDLPFYLKHQTIHDLKNRENEIDEMLEGLRQKPRLDIHTPYPNYLNTLLSSLLEKDFDYQKSFEKFLSLDCDYSKLTFEEIKTFITGLYRSEQGCLGSIIPYVEEGELYMVVKRLKELLSQEDIEEE